MALSDLPVVSHLTLEKRVHREILQAILSGRLSPGSSVTITELAKQLGVSLMPVRQALKALEAKNLIHVKRNRRLVVRTLSVADLDELFEIRLQLEQTAARAAVPNWSEEMTGSLERLLGEMTACEDREVYLEKNREFHHAIYRAAGRPILMEIIEDLWHRVSPYMHLYLAIEVNSHHPCHSGMLEGMRERDADTVCHWLRMDVQKAAAELSRQIEAQRG
jgi:DNA-binding GntR family transcriptional regulator